MIAKQTVDLKLNAEYIILRIGNEMKKDLSKIANENEASLTDFIMNIIYNIPQVKEKVVVKKPLYIYNDGIDDEVVLK